jgi:hypothetical protein
MTQTEQAAKRTEEFDYEIKDEDIERAKLLLGVDAPTSIDEYYRELSADGIRNFARAYGDDNPLFADPDHRPPPGGAARSPRR